MRFGTLIITIIIIKSIIMLFHIPFYESLNSLKSLSPRIRISLLSSSSSLSNESPKKKLLKSFDFLENENQSLNHDHQSSTSPPTFKIGSDLRKENRELLRQERVKLSQKYSTKSSIKLSTQSSSSSQKIRFKLGNGFDVLTTESLIGLVKLTAPYFFPDHQLKLVIDEDIFDFYNKKNFHPHSNNHQIHSIQSNQSILRLAHLSEGKDGWLKILQSPWLFPSYSSSSSSSTIDNIPSIEERIDYFTLCLASHFTTCATYVPTDVDSKIRGHCWFDPDEKVLKEQYQVVKNALLWDVESVSKRTIRVSKMDPMMLPISGHDGEFLGILTGAWGAFLRLGNVEQAMEIEHFIDRELWREANTFRYLCNQPSSIEIDTMLLKLCAIMTHNVGDIDQGLSYWIENYTKKNNKLSKDETKQYKYKYSKLAHERFDRYNGEFGRAKIIYKELLSAEGHRNYPLREAKCLRNSLDFALPLGPWLEDWGKEVARHPLISEGDLVTIVKQLIRGCDSQSKSWCVPNQIGYYRALNGIASVTNFEKLTKSLDKECKACLKTHEMRHHLSLSPEAFSSKLGIRAREILSTLSTKKLVSMEPTQIQSTGSSSSSKEEVSSS